MQAIFDHQLSLMHKYHPIEVSLGYTPPDPHHLPLDINTRTSQDRLRQFAWWVTEECVEAMTAPKEEFAEEMSDVLHFLVELCLLSGVPAPSMDDVKGIRSFELFPETYELIDIIKLVGKSMNLLKMKPWRKNPPQTSQDQFRRLIEKSLHHLIQLIMNRGLEPCEIYFAKHQKNSQRIENGY